MVCSLLSPATPPISCHLPAPLPPPSQLASVQGVRVLVDAEQSYFQPAIRHFTVHYLMSRCNSQQPLIYDTLQTYLTVGLLCS